MKYFCGFSLKSKSTSQTQTKPKSSSRFDASLNKRDFVEQLHTSIKSAVSNGNQTYQQYDIKIDIQEFVRVKIYWSFVYFRMKSPNESILNFVFLLRQVNLPVLLIISLTLTEFGIDNVPPIVFLPVCQDLLNGKCVRNIK